MSRPPSPDDPTRASPPTPPADDGEARLTPGTTLGGRYLIIEELGRGGFGAVYRARDLQLEREIALKILHAPALSPEMAQNLVREGRATARLEHENIVPVYDAGEVDGMPFLTTGLVSGRPLREVIEDAGAFPPERAANILSQLGAALDHAHEAGIVHRDIKPGNILLEKGDRVRIVDFGIARMRRAAGADSSISGTLGYMAPEMLRGDQSTPRSDVFAAGAVLFEMLTGRQSFRASSAEVLKNKVLKQRTPSAEQLRPGLPPGTDALIARAMSKHPESRTSSVGALARSFSRLLEEPAEEPARSGRGIAAAATAGILLVIMAVVVVWLLNRQIDRLASSEAAVTPSSPGAPPADPPLNPVRETGPPAGSSPETGRPPVRADLNPGLQGGIPAAGGPARIDASLMMSGRDGVARPVSGQSPTTVDTGDRYWIEGLHLSRPMYMQVLQADREGAVTQLFPHQPGDRLQRFDRVARMPAGHAWTVEGQAGPKTIVLGVAENPITGSALLELERQLRRVMGDAFAGTSPPTGRSGMRPSPQGPPPEEMRQKVDAVLSQHFDAWRVWPLHQRPAFGADPERLPDSGQPLRRPPPPRR